MMIAIALLLGILGLAIGFAAFSALVRARLFRFVFRALVSMVLIVAGAGLGLIALGTEGMRALTKEETAARIKVVPSGLQRYDATVTFADGRVAMIDAWFASIDTAMAAVFPPERIVAMKIRERIRTLIGFRLDHARPNREAARSAPIAPATSRSISSAPP